MFSVVGVFEKQAIPLLAKETRSGAPGIASQLSKTANAGEPHL
jgi:hypothetical protein